MSQALDLDPRSVTQLFRDLFSRDVTVHRNDRAAGFGQNTDLVAIYVDESGQPRAACVCPLGTAATLGAALSLIPSSRVTEVLRAGKLDESLLENFSEVCNVMVAFLDLPAMPPLTLSEVTTGALPAGVFDDAPRAIIQVDINGYDEGVLLLTARPG
jgi:hypothetical protein